MSIVLVVLGHLAGGVLGPYAHFGVQVFFVISGYLITTLLLQEERRAGCIDLGSFYWRRCFRILPASLVYTTIIVLLLHPPRGIALAAYTFTTGYIHSTWQLGHLWSLGDEEQFYLLWPLAMMFLPKKPAAWGIMLLSALSRVWMVHHYGSLQYAFPAVADCMGAGCLLALYAPALEHLRWPLPITLALIVASAFGAITIQTRNVLYWGLEPILIALTIFALVQRKDWLLNNRPVTYLGTLSYAVYLVQQPFTQRR